MPLPTEQWIAIKETLTNSKLCCVTANCVLCVVQLASSVYTETVKLLKPVLPPPAELAYLACRAQ